MKTVFFIFILTVVALSLGAAQTKDTASARPDSCVYDSAMMKAAAAKDSTAAVKVVNADCPVSGEPVKADGGTYRYRGKTYGFCCPGCIDTFRKDPETYIKSLDAPDRQHQQRENQPW